MPRKKLTKKKSLLAVQTNKKEKTEELHLPQVQVANKFR